MLKRGFLKFVLAGILASLLVIVLASCSSGSQAKSLEPTSPNLNQPEEGTNPAAIFVPYIPAGKPANPVKQIVIDAKVTGDNVSILVNKVTSNLNSRFKVDTEQVEMTFMAFVWDGKVYVRADICPPYRSKSFTLNKGVLVCDSCGTVFDAVSGKGITGACVAYPKQSAPYQFSSGNIVISKADLVTAYKSTMNPN